MTLRVFFGILLLLSVVPGATGQATRTCAAFESWIAAQTVFESDPDHHAALDPDGDGIACPDLPRQGIAPLLWAETIPTGAEEAKLDAIVDGDTFYAITRAGRERVRMYHMDAPEFAGSGGPEQCGAQEATRALGRIFGTVPEGRVWLEYDRTERDRYDRRLAYVWFERDGEIFMINEAMIRTGWAESETFEPDVRYREELDAAERFSIEHRLGVREECGRFDIPLEPTPTPTVAAPASGGGDRAGCEPAYPEVCIPLRAEVGDLDCGDIPHRRFIVRPPDPHSFDGDLDGVGCEGG